MLGNWCSIGQLRMRSNGPNGHPLLPYKLLLNYVALFKSRWHNVRYLWRKTMLNRQLRSSTIDKQVLVYDKHKLLRFMASFSFNFFCFPLFLLETKSDTYFYCFHWSFLFWVVYCFLDAGQENLKAICPPTHVLQVIWKKFST